jgi:hypothetical protein
VIVGEAHPSGSLRLRLVPTQSRISWADASSLLI